MNENINEEQKLSKTKAGEEIKNGYGKKSVHIKRIENEVLELKLILEKMREDMKKMARVQEIDRTTAKIKQEETPIKKLEKTRNNTPIPEDYRKAVDLILNQEFGIMIEPRSDTPEFNFVIVVPEKYSDLDLNEKRMHKVDLRSKNVSYAEKTGGVKAWAEKVYNSFNMETKAQIAADRKLS
ncbi:MAG: hypothetical protein WC441_05405 [Patescibacteria group bacterium]